MADAKKSVDDDKAAALSEAAATDIAESGSDKKIETAEETTAKDATPATGAAAAAEDSDDDSVKNVSATKPKAQGKDVTAAKVEESTPVSKTATEDATAAGAGDVKATSEAPKDSTETTSAKTTPPTAATETASETPASAPAAPAAPPAAPSPAPEASPEVKELHAMFPAIEIGVIAIVLESVNGSQDRAIEQLLAMNDPDFRPDDAAARQAELDRQAALDAEFARALIMQEQEDERAQQASYRHGGGEPGQLPYQPRVRRARPGQEQLPGYSEHAAGQPGQPGQGQHGQGQHGEQGGQFEEQLAAFEEKVTQIAEQGRQTFNTLFNRAKAKYDEFAAQQAANAAARQQAQAEGNGGPAAVAGHGAGNAGGAGRGSGFADWQNRASGAAAGAVAGASGLAAGASARLNALWGTGQQQQGQQGPDRTGSASPSGRPAAARWSPTDSYEDMHDAQPLSTGATINVGGRASPARAGSTPPPAAAAAQQSQAGKIDMAKLGFLPKKRVDLMSSSPAPATSAAVGGAAGNASATSLASAGSGKSLVDKIPKSPVSETSPHTLGDSDDELEYTE